MSVGSDTAKRCSLVIIGGGVIGCSLLYHLAKAGWADVVLVEGATLTSGSTWHAAANGNTFNGSPLMAWAMKRTFELWAEVQEESGQNVGAHPIGGVMIARTPDRMDELARLKGIGRRIGVDYQDLTPEQLKERLPFLNTDTVLGGMYDPMGGHVDPYGLTHAYARAARKMGAQIWQDWKVSSLTQTDAGGWVVQGDNGEIHCDVVVNAAGLYADEIAKMTGARLPMVNMKHHYLITEPIEAVRDLAQEPPIFRDVDAGVYGRREGGGILFGIYEKDCEDFGFDQMPDSFVSQLFDADLDRLIPEMEHVFDAIPCIEDSGIKSAINGPFVFTPDGLPLIGWMPGQQNHFCAAGFLAGISLSGGFGQLMAEWITDGAPHRDVSSCDVLRFGDWAVGDYARARAHDTYGTRYKMHFPNEEIAAGRPLRMTPMYARYADMGAFFGTSDGWERPNWFAGQGRTAVETPSFRRNEAHDAMARECDSVHRSAGYTDLISFANYLVEGPDAERFLKRILPGKLPQSIGRLSLSPIVNHKGRTMGDATILRLGPQSFMLVASGGLSRIHLRGLLPLADGLDLTFENRTDTWSGFSVAGPNARRIVQAAMGDVDVPAFFGCKQVMIGGVSCTVLRLSYVGELSYEIHCAMNDQIALHDALLAAAGDLEFVPFGARAMNAMRIETGLPRTGDELTIEATPFELGMGWMLDLKRGDTYLGKEALLDLSASMPRYKLVTLILDDTDVDPVGREPLMHGDQVAGYISSATFGHRVGKTIALGFVMPEFWQDGTVLDAMVLRTRVRAVVSHACAFDPEGTRARS